MQQFHPKLRPLPRPRLPVTPEDAAKLTGLREASRPSDAQVREFHNLLCSSGADTLSASLCLPYWRNSCSSLGLLLMAVDLLTGDSAMHAVVAANRMEGLRAVADIFGANLTVNPIRMRCFHLLFEHQNHAGDTVLHTAASGGRLGLLTAVYRLFWLDGTWDNLDVDPETHEEGVAERWMFDDDDIGYFAPALLFLVCRNEAGRTAAEEARAAGHDDAGTWLDEVQGRLDPDGQRTTEQGILKMKDVINENLKFI